MKKWGDLTGMLGDLGILLPILLGLSLFNGMNFSLMLGMVGVAYVLTSLAFRLPVPVQPFKIACTLALAQGLGQEVLQAAALMMAAFLLLIGVTGLASRLYKRVPVFVIRGLQLGVGLLLMKSGMAWMVNGSIYPEPVFVGASSIWMLALVSLVIPQLPLTVTNASLGSSFVAHRYYRWLAKKVNPNSLCISMGLLNVMMGLVGAMPTCHGSSGWTAHRRSGARSFRTTLFLGLILILTATLTGSAAMECAAQIPFWVLASLLIYIGTRHALLVRDVTGKELILASAVGAATFLSGNAAIGLILGCGLYFAQRFLQWRKENYVNAH